MQFPKITVFVLFAITAISCRATTTVENNYHPAALDQLAWESAREASFKAENTNDKQEKARLAKEGIAYAEECIMKNPEDAACYYYRAINTGIYYSAHVVGYQDGIKSMIKDCEEVIRLDDKLDHGGAYRTLGKIYTDMPETTVSKNGMRRDLDKAVANLKKAVQIDGNYPENNIYLATALLEAGKKSEAMTYLTNALTLTPQWRNHRDYSMWQKLNKALSGKLK